MKPLPLPLAGVFLDLDGTVLDSAQDLYAALVSMCADDGVTPPAFDLMRQVVSRGSRAILATAYAHDSSERLLERMPAYLARYERDIALHTRPFEGMDEVLLALEERGVPWGIVTNKPGFLTDRLLAELKMDVRAASVVSGDTLPVKKPDPAPVLLACERAGVDPARCVFVGDDRRDVEAGRAAGCYTVAVGWGYLDGGDPRTWGADLVVDTVGEFAAVLGLPIHA
jgi:N-acetyl-D-muramate 6-phosphate phosphatase